MTQHTQGPWKIIEHRHPYKDGSKAHIERNIYTERIDPQLKDHYPIVSMGIGLGMNGEKAVTFIHMKEADAHLIAAAPDLLDELKRLYKAYVNLMENGRDRIVDLGGDCDPLDVMEANDPRLRDTRAIIAKATGAA